MKIVTVGSRSFVTSFQLAGVSGIVSETPEDAFKEIDIFLQTLLHRFPLYAYMEIDTSKDVYLFVHGRKDLVEKSTEALVSKGFLPEKIIQALSEKTGNVGDYMAMLWMPPNPDHIKVQQITAVDPNVEPKDMTGAWAGVSKDDLFTVKL